jgi:hypothetical protein
MYTKLYAAIVDSTLMEEPVIVRYVFMTMLAIADQDGYVSSTPKAAASRLAISLEEFESAMEVLSAPDLNSNFPDHDGRRIIPSDRGRGWLIVTFRHYSEMRNEHGKREYMRDYMREYRAKAKASREEVKPVKVYDPNALTTLAHIEGDGDGDKSETKKNTKTPKKEEDEELFQIWNSMTELPKIVKISQSRKASLKTRMKDPFFRENWRKGLNEIPTRPFMLGVNEKGWAADIDWFLKPDSLTKIIEGKYKSGSSQQPATSRRPQITLFPQS